jgi:RNA polymerase sigma factor for flagellar operon FliA
MATLVAVPTNGFVPQAAVLQTSLSTGHAATEINVTDYLALVRAIARRMHRTLPRHIDLDDLISAGYLGLVDAAEKFQESKQTQFRSYAEFRVRGAILDSLRELDWGTRSLRRKVRDIEVARQSLVANLGSTPEDADVARELGVSLADLRATLTEARSLETESLQAEREDADSQDLLASLADPSAHDALTLCLEGEFKQALVDAIDALPERERLIVTLSYYEELTLKEIGDLLSLTISRVSQLRTAAINRLKTALKDAR